MNAAISVDRPTPRILVKSSITGVDLEQYVPVKLVQSGVTYIILYSMFATLLFVLLCAVLFKNGLSPQKRKLPVVWVLGLAMFGGLLGSVLNTIFWAYQLFGDAGQGTIYRLWISSTAMLYVTPLVTHIAVQLRMMSFYPATLASRRKRIAIAAFPTSVKIARIVMIAYTLQISASEYYNMASGWADGGSRTDELNLTIFVLQFVDTFYATCLLLYKFHSLGRRDNQLMHQNAHWSIAWLKQLMYGLAFGYVLPTAFGLALVVCKVVNINPTDLGYVLVANVYMQAFGAVIAMLSQSHRWREDRFTASYRPEQAVQQPRLHHGRETPSLNSADLYDLDGDEVLDMHEARGSAPASYETRDSLSAAERGQSRQALSRSRTPDLGLKHLISGLHEAESRPSLSSKRTRDSSSVSLRAPERAQRSSAIGTDDAPTPQAEIEGLPQLFVDLPPGFDADQLEKRRSSDVTLISNAALNRTTANAKMGGTLSSSASTLSSQQSSRSESRGTDRAQRLDSSRTIPLSVAEEDIVQDGTAKALR